jgi:hypothetical protein
MKDKPAVASAISSLYRWSEGAVILVAPKAIELSVVALPKQRVLSPLL